MKNKGSSLILISLIITTIIAVGSSILFWKKPFSQPKQSFGSYTLQVPQGGTGRSSLSANALLAGNGIDPIISTSAPTVGYIVATNTTQTSIFQNTNILYDAGFNTTSPYGQISIEVLNDGNLGVGSNTPIFVIGDQGTSSPVFVINYLGEAGIGTDPSYTFQINSLATSTNDVFPFSINPTLAFSATTTTGFFNRMGGDGANNEVGSGWADNTYEAVVSQAVYNNHLYVGLGKDIGDAEVWMRDSINIEDTVWTQIGGDGINNSWPVTTYEEVLSMVVFNGELYAGLGNSAGDAEVWKYSNNSWLKIGGDAIKSSWADGTYEGVYSMAVYGGKLYAGLGNGTGDAEVWEYDGSFWKKVGGDAINSSWADVTFQRVTVMIAFNGSLYVGLGTDPGDAEVWKYDGKSWTRKGGDAILGSWADATYQSITSMTIYNNFLVVGLGSTAGYAEVWRYNHPTNRWEKIGGDAINSSWADSTYEEVPSLAVFNGKLYAGLGTGSGDAELWEFDGANWTLKGGDGISGSWANNAYGNVFSLLTYNDTLLVGLGDTNVAGNAELWQLKTDVGSIAYINKGLSLNDTLMVSRFNNVGINTYDPQASLDIYGDVRIGGSSILATSSRIGIATTAPWGNFAIEQQWTNLRTNDDETFPAFVVSDAGTNTPSFIILNSNNNVGIATSVPPVLFSVGGQSLFNGTTTIQTDLFIGRKLQVKGPIELSATTQTLASSIELDFHTDTHKIIPELTGDVAITFKNFDLTGEVVNLYIYNRSSLNQVSWASTTAGTVIFQWLNAKSTTTPPALTEGLNLCQFTVLATATTPTIVSSCVGEGLVK